MQDPYGIEFWPEFKGRDGCRTPMVWDANTNTHGGFSTAKPWLPVPAEHLARAVSAQQANPNSVLNHYRDAIALRHRHPALRLGEQQIRAEGDVLIIERQQGDDRVTLRANLSNNATAGLAPWQVEINEG